MRQCNDAHVATQRSWKKNKPFNCTLDKNILIAIYIYTYMYAPAPAIPHEKHLLTSHHLSIPGTVLYTLFSQQNRQNWKKKGAEHFKPNRNVCKFVWKVNVLCAIFVSILFWFSSKLHQIITVHRVYERFAPMMSGCARVRYTHNVITKLFWRGRRVQHLEISNEELYQLPKNYVLIKKNNVKTIKPDISRCSSVDIHFCSFGMMNEATVYIHPIR